MILGSLIESQHATRALDIGAGTGVLSLMVLQRNPNVFIDAIEINPDSAAECDSNIKNSPWPKRAQVHFMDYMNFSSKQKYELIFTNPPFYMDGLKSGDAALDQAKHMHPTMLDAWMRKTHDHLTENGIFYLIFPGNHWLELVQLAEMNHFHLTEKILIHGSEDKLNVRVVAAFSKRAAAVKCSELTIRQRDGNYSKEYIELTAAFHGTDLARKS